MTNATLTGVRLSLGLGPAAAERHAQVVLLRDALLHDRLRKPGIECDVGVSAGGGRRNNAAEHNNACKQSAV